MITCQELVEFLDEYVAGEMDDERRRVFEEHLGACPPCVDYLESYRQTIAMGKCACDDLKEAPPSDVPDGLIQAILAARKKDAD